MNDRVLTHTSLYPAKPHNSRNYSSISELTRRESRNHKLKINVTEREATKEELAFLEGPLKRSFALSKACLNLKE